MIFVLNYWFKLVINNYYSTTSPLTRSRAALNEVDRLCVTPLVCAFFYIYNDHARTVLLSTFTLLFTVTGDLEKTWRAQNRQSILLVRSQNCQKIIHKPNEYRKLKADAISTWCAQPPVRHKTLLHLPLCTQ